MKFYVQIIFFCFFYRVSAQEIYTPLENSQQLQQDKEGTSLASWNHTGIKPFLNNIYSADEYSKKNISLFDNVLGKNLMLKGKKVGLTLLPLGGLYYEKYNGKYDTLTNINSIGFTSDFACKNFELHADFTAASGTFSPFMIRKFDTLNIIPGFGYRYNSLPGKIYYENLNFHLNWSPNRFINFQIGRGKNFWGNGYRSLFLSDVATSYPFIKFTTNFWHIKYVSLVAQLKDIRGSNGNPSKYFNKYATFHILSWNITKRFNLQIFESVVWQSKDTLQNRQLDINYLNPVIFYRPVEYSLGSSDNSLMGLGLNFKPFEKSLIYGQWLLDEFVLEKVREKNGWWANKFALQIGIKVYDAFKVKGLLLQTEYNAIRPYTYSHGSIYQNYAHFNQPLAHPMGANSRDWVSIINYTFKFITINNRLILGNYGSDNDSTNFGGNLYQSYKTRPGDYNHYIGQGIDNDLFIWRTGIECLLIKQNNLKIEIGFMYRKLSNLYYTEKTPFVFFGIKANLYNVYNDF